MEISKDLKNAYAFNNNANRLRWISFSYIGGLGFSPPERALTLTFGAELRGDLGVVACRDRFSSGL